MIFIDSENGRCLIVNYKVMYSSIVKIGSYNLAGWGKWIKLQLKSKLLFKGDLKTAIIVRSPDKRLESFFKDKLRKNAEMNPATKNFQFCQTLFFGAAGVKKGDDSRTISLKLRSLSFSEFTAALPELYQLDGHLHPQVNSLCGPVEALKGFWQKMMIRTSRTVKLENMEDMLFLQRAFGVDIHHHENNTREVQEEIIWDNKSREIVRELYKEDYKTFAYE